MADSLDDAKALLFKGDFDGNVSVYLVAIIDELEKQGRHLSENKKITNMVLEQVCAYQRGFDDNQKKLELKMAQDVDKETRKIKIWFRIQNKKIRRLTAMTFVSIGLCLLIGAQTNPETTKTVVEFITKAAVKIF